MRSTGLPFLLRRGEASFGLRLTLVGLPLALLGLGLPACSTDTTPAVYSELTYQVRCLDCEPRAPDEASHTIKVVNGENGYKLGCAVERVDAVRRVTFSVEHNDPAHPSMDHMFKVASGNLDAAESEPRCSLQVLESANTYVGSCSSSAPDPEAGVPCQATFELKAGVITGGVYCTAIANSANLFATRYLVAPNTRSEPAHFEIHGCSGL
jgi:hypothetical protein